MLSGEAPRPYLPIILYFRFVETVNADLESYGGRRRLSETTTCSSRVKFDYEGNTSKRTPIYPFSSFSSDWKLSRRKLGSSRMKIRQGHRACWMSTGRNTAG